MSIIREWNEEQEKQWRKWVEERPEPVRTMARNYPPNRLYRMKSTGQRVILFSYSEDGTVTVDVTGEYNLVIFDRQVFGVDINNLEECDLPGEDEISGTFLTEEEDVDAHIDMIRPMILSAKKDDEEEKEITKCAE